MSELGELWWVVFVFSFFLVFREVLKGEGFSLIDKKNATSDTSLRNVGMAVFESKTQHILLLSGSV